MTTYTERLESALEEIKQTYLTVTEAANKYCLPTATLRSELGESIKPRKILQRKPRQVPPLASKVITTPPDPAEPMRDKVYHSSEFETEDDECILDLPEYSSFDADIALSTEAFTDDVFLANSCRGCGNKNSLILYNLYKPKTLKLFKMCTRIDPSESPHLSNAICVVCVDKCKEWYQFRRRCVRTEQQLESIFMEEKKRKSKSYEEGTNLHENEMNDTFSHDDYIIEQDDGIIQQEDDLYTQIDTIDQDDSLVCESITEDIDMNCEDDNSDFYANLVEEAVSDVSKIGQETHIEEFSESKLQFYCQQCYKSFTTAQRFESHLFYHEMMKNLKCQKCDVPFSAQDELAAHCKTEHPGECINNYGCSLCGQFFSKYHYLRSHMTGVHMKKKHKLCSFCGLQFTSHTRMKEHIVRIHTPEAPKIFKCDYCHKKFTTKTARSNHLVFHRKQPNIICKICGKGFKTRHNLKTHSIVHVATVQCPNCLLSWQTMNELKNHLKTCVNKPVGLRSPPPDVKTSRKKPICPLCYEVCNNISSFSIHLKNSHMEDGVDIHEVLESVKTKQCDLCPKRFLDDLALYNHKTKIHVEKTSKCPQCFHMFRNVNVLRVHMLNSCKMVNSVDKPSQDLFEMEAEIGSDLIGVI